MNADDAAEKEEQLPDEIGDVKVADEVISSLQDWLRRKSTVLLV